MQNEIIWVRLRPDKQDAGRLIGIVAFGGNESDELRGKVAFFDSTLRPDESRGIVAGNLMPTTIERSRDRFIVVVPHPPVRDCSGMNQSERFRRAKGYDLSPNEVELAFERDCAQAGDAPPREPEAETPQRPSWDDETDSGGGWKPYWQR
jgi:hypothetical protein